MGWGVVGFALHVSGFTEWFNTTNNRITYAGGGTNYLVGHQSQPSNACLAQLIYAGPDGQIAAAVAGGDGVSSDDVVVAKAWVGRGIFTSPNGRLSGGAYSGGTEGWLYYVRLWSAPSPDYTNGVAPVFPTNFHGDSALKAYPGMSPDDFNFGGPTGFSTVLKPRIIDSDANGLPDWWEYTYFRVFTNTPLWEDADTDSVVNVDEYIAGTDPTKAWSVLELDFAGYVQPSNRILRWQTEAGHTYVLERGTNRSGGPAADFAFTAITNNLSASGGWIAYTDRVEGVGPHFYRVSTAVFTNW